MVVPPGLPSGSAATESGLMSPHVAAAKKKPWKSIDTIITMENLKLSYVHKDEKVLAFAETIGAPLGELIRWAAKIAGGLKARPAALQCHMHLMDLRQAAREPPCVQPRDVIRRADALARAKALAAVLPVWPNPPPAPPSEWELSGRGVLPKGRGVLPKARSHGPHERRGRPRIYDDE
jgi:hypothetical protein